MLKMTGMVEFIYACNVSLSSRTFCFRVICEKRNFFLCHEEYFILAYERATDSNLGEKLVLVLISDTNCYLISELSSTVINPKFVLKLLCNGHLSHFITLKNLENHYMTLENLKNRHIIMTLKTLNISFLKP